MSDDESARLGLPYLAAGQMQKHVTVNEALTRLDALVQCRAASRTVATAPAAPEPEPAAPLRTNTPPALLPGAETLNAIYQILISQPVAPNKAWGGYYVFDMPKAVSARRANQPLSILVRTGAEEHRFSAVLKWKR